MSSIPRDWLPIGVVGHASVRTLLTAAAEAWAEHWFARRRVAIGVIDAAPGGALERDPGRFWQRRGTSLAINIPAGGPSLASWLLDVSYDPLVISPAEQAILASLEAAVLTDLCERTERALSLPDSASVMPQSAPDTFSLDGGAVVELKELGGGLVLRMAIPLGALASASKLLLPAREVSAAPLQSRLAALGQIKVKAEAYLGSVEVSFKDLHDLAPGDVLVLNTRLDGLAVLAVEGAARTLAYGRISNAEGRLSLTLEAC